MFALDEDTRPATEAEAHLEWHLNAGVPVGQGPCPWDACHPDDDYPEEEDAMATLTLTEISTSRFTYSPPDNTFTAEASDLPRDFERRIYDDACDVGFVLVSAKTGRKVTFVFVDESRDAEGELLWTTYRPANTDEWAAGTVKVWND